MGVGILLIVATIVVVMLIIRRKNQSSSSDYEPLRATSVSDVGFSSAAASSSHVIGAPTPVNHAPLILAKRARFDFTADPAASVLGGRAGDVFQITSEDWRDGGEWVWASKNPQEQGYIPRQAVM